VAEVAGWSRIGETLDDHKGSGSSVPYLEDVLVSHAAPRVVIDCFRELAPG